MATVLLEPAQEAERLLALRRYDVLDTPPDGSFDRITRLAARLLDVPVALVSLVDEDRIWFKSRTGLESVTQLPREPGLCATAILSDDVYLVEDARRDPRTLANPLVAGDFGLQFYAAAPLRTTDGYRLGTLCVIDHAPRHLSVQQQELLEQLAGVVMDEMELRLAARTVVGAERHERQVWEDVAAVLRTSLLPERLPRVPGVDLFAVCEPADPAVVGGDFYDVFPASDGTWLLAMGDVCGKGPAAAAVTAAARHTLRAEALHGTDPAQILDRVSNALYVQSDDDFSARWCTLALARLELTTDGPLLHASCGGHPMPRVVRANGAVEPLGEPGTALGLLEYGQRRTSTVRLGPGDTVIFFTDGVTEARRGAKLFGEEALEALLAAHAHEGPERLIAQVLEELARPWVVRHDDAALLVARFR